MPISKKRKKSGTKIQRRREAAAPASVPAAEPAPAGGLLGRMRGGIRNVAGAGGGKKESPVLKVLTWLLVALVAYFAAKRLGIIR